MVMQTARTQRETVPDTGHAVNALALEIAELQSNQLEGGAGECSVIDRRISQKFERLMRLLNPQIVGLIRRYGLADIKEDARQACAIGIYRAVQGYDPHKASFLTFATWQMRGELQSLRHRMRLDQRQSARNAGAVTMPLTAQPGGTEQELEIADTPAEQRVEAAASRVMAGKAFDAVWAQYCAQSRAAAKVLDRTAILAEERALFDAALNSRPEPRGPIYNSPERRRQARRRVTRHLRNLVMAGGRTAAEMSA